MPALWRVLLPLAIVSWLLTIGFVVLFLTHHRALALVVVGLDVVVLVLLRVRMFRFYRGRR